jgi:hypothetical protein
VTSLGHRKRILDAISRLADAAGQSSAAAARPSQPERGGAVRRHLRLYRGLGRGRRRGVAPHRRSLPEPSRHHRRRARRHGRQAPGRRDHGPVRRTARPRRRRPARRRRRRRPAAGDAGAVSRARSDDLHPCRDRHGRCGRRRHRQRATARLHSARRDGQPRRAPGRRTFQARADAVATLFGQHAPRPMSGERLRDYKRRASCPGRACPRSSSTPT